MEASGVEVEVVTYAKREDFLRIDNEDLTESLSKVATASQRQPQGLTFLSHSSKDDEVMPGVVRILERAGATVYLDRVDRDLADQTVRDIAKTLRNRIKVAKKFVLFASANVKDSRWVPWELGLADGFKNSGSVAIFPSAENQREREWSEQEYLGVYDRIVWGRRKGETSDQWLVWDQINNVAWHLREWLGRE